MLLWRSFSSSQNSWQDHIQDRSRHGLPDICKFFLAGVHSKSKGSWQASRSMAYLLGSLWGCHGCRAIVWEQATSVLSSQVCFPLLAPKLKIPGNTLCRPHACLIVWSAALWQNLEIFTKFNGLPCLVPNSSLDKVSASHSISFWIKLRLALELVCQCMRRQHF